MPIYHGFFALENDRKPAGEAPPSCSIKAFALFLDACENAVPLEGCPILFPLRWIGVAFGGGPFQGFLIRFAA